MARFTIIWKIRHETTTNHEHFNDVDLDATPLPGMKLRTGTIAGDVTIQEVIIDPRGIHMIILDSNCESAKLANALSRAAKEAGWR
jgi:hypothetical protein